MNDVFSDRFLQYGRVIDSLNFSEIYPVLRTKSPKPDCGTVYVASAPVLENLSAFDRIRDVIYGGMPIQMGYCNGQNTKLNCLEYHRGSEFLIPADEIALMVAPLQNICNGTLSTDCVECFLVPAQTPVLLYETTLHYAPAHTSHSFQVACVLPRGTNSAYPLTMSSGTEGRFLWACNKWLLAHVDAPEAKDGASIALTGKNLDLTDFSFSNAGNA